MFPKLTAEALGTFWLVLGGCGSAVLAAAFPNVGIGLLGVSLAFGLVTPPYGLCLMIACSVAGMRIRDAIKDTAIMLVPMLMVLALVIVWPEVSLILPKLISPEFLK